MDIGVAICLAGAIAVGLLLVVRLLHINPPEVNG